MTVAQVIMSPWIAVPLAGVVMFTLALHQHALARATMDARRRRIRSVNNILMMFLTALLAYGFSAAGNPRTFVFVWTIISALLFMIIMLALSDMLQSVQIHRRERKRLRERLRELESSRVQGDSRA